MGELVTMQGEPIRKGRISPALRTAITLIVHEGLTVADAAKRTGFQRESLAKALIKPHVKAFRASVKRAWMDSKTEQAWLTVGDLASSAASEDVRLKAARVFIEADADAKARMPDQVRQQVQIIANHVHLGDQLPNEQQGGVIEAPAYQVLSPQPSNSETVGRGESDDE